MAKPNVIIYTMNDCPFCEKALEILDDMKIKYEERNVSTSLKHREELFKRTRDDKIPTVIVNEEVLVKPGEDKLRAVINFELHR